MLCPECFLGLYDECTNPQGQAGNIPCGREDLIALDKQENKPDRADTMLQTDSVIDFDFDALSESMATEPVEVKTAIPRTEWDPEDGEELTFSTKTGRKQKPNGRLRNPQRTGRARANSIKPIKPGDTCEWAGLKFAGGGIIPIVGCLGNAAITVHHGPDKDWLNNEETNLHKLCRDCHTAYHKFNDPFYIWQRPEPGTPFYFREEVLDKVVPHDTETVATKQEILKNIMERENIDGVDLLEDEE